MNKTLCNKQNKELHFHQIGLDDRILKAIAKLGWSKPTLIQEKAIPLLLEGKDVLLKARTGSGKTGAFVIPIIQRILEKKQLSRDSVIRALVLAPTRELCNQITAHIRQLTAKCSRDVVCVDISPTINVNAQKPLLADSPDIIISTPSRALLHLRANTFDLCNSLEMLVIDEADLVFSLGHENDLKQVLTHLPRVHQSALASATLSEDVTALKKLVLHNAVILKLQEPELAPVSQLTHYVIHAEEDDKAAILYALLKLNLIRGKTIVFVNTVDKCYKLKLFLEQFSIHTCLLNSELPAKIRCHSVMQFNRGLYDIIISSDESALVNPAPNYIPDEPPNKKRKKDKESGVVRGIDFQEVSNVINFDFPLDATSYIHRAGRTARGANKGTALSFVSVKEKIIVDEIEERFRKDFADSIFQAYQFKLQEVEGFRYRAKDAWRAVTRIAVREARLKEIKQDILNNQKLKGYFEENPRDLKSLRHDKALHTVKIQPHLSDVPSYLVPSSLQYIEGASKPQQKNKFKLKPRSKDSFKARIRAKKDNPLISMEFNGFKKKKRKQSHE